MTKKFKQLYLKNAIIALMNVLQSVLFEAAPNFVAAEKKELTEMGILINSKLNYFKKQIPKRQMEKLEEKTDVDYRLWVQTQFVKSNNMNLFEAEFKDLIKKYS